jgi:hypothetical protein
MGSGKEFAAGRSQRRPEPTGAQKNRIDWIDLRARLPTSEPKRAAICTFGQVDCGVDRRAGGRAGQPAGALPYPAQDGFAYPNR